MKYTEEKIQTGWDVGERGALSHPEYKLSYYYLVSSEKEELYFNPE